MKKALHILLGLVLIVVTTSFIVLSTNNLFNPQGTTELAVLRDITDSLISAPNVDEIISKLDLSEDNKWNGFIFRYSTLSDVSYNKISETKINREDKWLSNEIERDKQLKTFKADMDEIISGSASVGKSNSSVYLPLARELVRLNESKSEKRMVIVYSDLMENSPELSFYDKKEFVLLQDNPDSLKKLFESWQSLPDLSGIEIYIVYHPSDIAKDTEFKIVSEFYRKMLEEKGARVNVSANLTI